MGVVILYCLTAVCPKADAAESSSNAANAVLIFPKVPTLILSSDA
jgi:hypothetical protein